MVHFSMATKWKLEQFLDEHGITVYELAKHTKISRNSLYKLVKEPQAVRFDTLDDLLPVLDRLTGQRVEVSDLLERKD